VIPSAEVPLARAWLLGTLPVEVLGPPLALATLAREQADLAARKLSWAAGLRWFLLGGGGVFLLTDLAADRDQPSAGRGEAHPRDPRGKRRRRRSPGRSRRRSGRCCCGRSPWS
jgi:hypothetical protein